MPDCQHDEGRLPVRQLCVRAYILIIFVIYLDATRWHMATGIWRVVEDVVLALCLFLIAMSVPLSERCRGMIDSAMRRVNDGPMHTPDAPEKQE
ncbi:hypothetical protein [Bifidobacterium moukalabense]|uniref:hypothetical protein n=1 Tax=Bifidobacterium moukalabense TaxID=1333651 RepID=UPI0010F8AF40|nr:hypothetical protein [Bifidobacterium moukalabense]